MKKIFTLLAVALFALTAQAQEGYTYQVKTLTFEDKDYPQNAPNYLGKTSWSSLIDTPQYGGELLYGENHGDTSKVASNVNYKWYDKGNTNLYSEIPENWGSRMYWGGGHAISNYWDGNLKNGDYNHQLSVYVADDDSNGQKGHGHNGSDNFCVHYGYRDGSGYSASNLPAIMFKDGQNHVIEGMYINNTTYFVNCVTNGNGLTSALGDKDYVRVEAIGYKADGSRAGVATTSLAFGRKYVVKHWTKWNLEELGEVNKVEFNVVGTSDNGYGFSQPAYFCYDDVAVRVPVSNNVSTKKISSTTYKAEKATDGLKTFTVKNDVFSADLSVVGDVPDGVTVEYDGDKVLNANETECLTIKGLLDNTIIREIVVKSVMREIFGVDMEVGAFYDGENIAKLKLVGWGSGFEDDSDVVIINQSFEEHEMIMLDDSRKPHSGELVFKQSSVNGHSDQMFVTSYKVSYELVASTGITEINSSTNAVEVSRFTADGKRISVPQKGINIIHMSDGSTRKVVVK